MIVSTVGFVLFSNVSFLFGCRVLAFFFIMSNDSAFWPLLPQKCCLWRFSQWDNIVQTTTVILLVANLRSYASVSNIASSTIFVLSLGRLPQLALGLNAGFIRASVAKHCVSIPWRSPLVWLLFAVLKSYSRR